MLETKSIAALAFTETPRKRKRETLSGNAAPPPNPQQQPLGKDAQVSHIHAQDAAVASATESCFTNAAFSSTPKKLMIGRRRLAKENSNPHPNPFPGLEVKSIADLAQEQLPTNPFEVLRQPPKKKKREQLACFENPGLNLELPEKQFNPYEVSFPVENYIHGCTFHLGFGYSKYSSYLILYLYIIQIFCYLIYVFYEIFFII